MPLPQDSRTLNMLLDQLSAQLSKRTELAMMLSAKLHNFGQGPVNIDIPPNYKITDIEAIKPIFEKFGFRVEIRFASPNCHMRFYRD